MHLAMIVRFTQVVSFDVSCDFLLRPVAVLTRPTSDHAALTLPQRFKPCQVVVLLS